MPKYDVGTIDLDWHSMKHHDDQPNSGMECLAEWLEDGWEVIAVWYDGTHSKALLKREAKAE